MMRGAIAGAVAAALACVASCPAQACRTADFQTPILHSALPSLADGVVAAEVEIITDVRSPSSSNIMDARVITMIRGDYRGDRIRIDPQYRTSCDRFPSPGTRGIVVGRILSTSESVLVIDPIRAPSAFEVRRRRASSTRDENR